MAVYTIRILNQSSLSKSYAVFMQPTPVVESGGAPHIYANAWATFENIRQGGWDSVDFSPDEDLGRDSRKDAAPRFLIADDETLPGQVSDASQAAATVAVDFTDRRQTVATVTQEVGGAFSVAYT